MSWPDLSYRRWAPTGASLHMWTQIVGKYRLRHTPWQPHSWHATLYVSARGLTTGPIPVGERTHEIVFDMLAQRLVALCASGKEAGFALGPMSVAEFHGAFLKALTEIGAPTDFHGRPNEVPDAVPFAQQTAAGAYDPAEARDFWDALRQINAVFSTFRTGYLGKVSPSHLFWGSFDLAVTRFSGRPAPLHPGGFPNLPDTVTREAYSHEVSSAGFWPGGGGVDEAMFYAYAYPVPPGFSQAPVAPEAGYFDPALGEFLLPYEAVRTAADPAAALMAFLDSTYEAAADCGGWDRAALDAPFGRAGVPRALG